MIDLDAKGLVRAIDLVAEGLERLLRADPRELLDDAGAALETAAKERFRSKESPEGEPWPKWSDDRYRERQLAKGASLMDDSGVLRGSISHQVEDDRVRVGSADKRAATLFYGDTRTAWGRVSATWPARQPLGISAEDRADLATDLESFVRSHGGLVLGT